jgi:hypothetical protein
MAKHEGFGLAPREVQCARCRRPVNRHSDSHEERLLDGSRRLYHRKRCWPKELRERKRTEKRQRRSAALARRVVASNGTMPDKTEHFVEPAPKADTPTTAMFQFTVDPLAPPGPSGELAPMPTIESDDPIDRESFNALLLVRSDGGVQRPRRAERVLRLLIERFKGRPFLLSELFAADPSLSESTYESQLRVIGQRTARVSHRLGGKGYPSTYLFHEPRRPLERPAFHLDPSLPHAKDLGASFGGMTPPTPPTPEVPMPETPTTTPSAAAATVSPLRRRILDRAAPAEPQAPAIDPQAVLTAFDTFEGLIADTLDEFRRDLRRTLGLDT